MLKMVRAWMSRARPHGVAHGRVIGGREEEDDAHLVQTGHGLLRRGLQRRAQRFEHVGAACTPVGAIAVLGDLLARARDHEGGDGADVELVGAVAARADDVDQHIVAGLERAPARRCASWRWRSR